MRKLRSIIVLSVILLTACVSEPLPEGFKDADDFDPVNAAKTRISLGLTYLQNGNYSQAKFNLDKALQFAPRLADAHYSMAYYYQLVGEIELAEEAYQTAMDFEPNNADIANTYGAFLCRQGKYDKAKKYFLKAVNSDNYVSTAETYENLALCSKSQGQLEDAKTYLQSAINHQPSRGKSLFLLTELQIENAQWPEAKQSLNRYEKVARVSAESLWMHIQIEEGLGNKDSAMGYGDMLIRMYPRHNRTQQYVKLRVKARPKPLPKASKVKSITANRVTAPQADISVSESAVKPAKDYQVDDVSTVSAEKVPQPSMPQLAADASSDVSKQTTTHHVVKKGENLYRISLLYNVKIKSLQAWNNLEEGASLFVGKKLVVVDPETFE